VDNSRQIVTVRIYNQTYSIRAQDGREEGSAERTEALAALVDARMQEIAKEAMTADTLKVAILAALHLADQLDRAEARHREILAQLSRSQLNCDRILDEIGG